MNQGALGSPLLATGGASIVDLFPLPEVPIYLSFWVIFAYAGPAIGPLIGNFAAEANGWRWPMWELTWLAGAAFALIFFCLPETSGPTILYWRAHRLRQATGNKKLRAQSEIDEQHINKNEVLFNALVRPAQMFLQDPAVMFTDVYVMLVYSIYYL